MQYTNVESAEEIAKWIGYYNSLLFKSDRHNPSIMIMTLEGPMIADLNDYVIKGVNGEFYPVKPDIFKKTYDILDDK